jgi:enterochelin esterase-like enzyme
MRALAIAILLAGCGSFAHRMEYGSHVSAAMNGARMDYAIYAPPDFTPGEEELPLVVFLHGGGDSHDAFDRHGVSASLDRGVAAGEVPRAIVVLPNGELGFWANWYDGSRRYEDWVTDELVPRVAGEYSTLDCPEHCHVMGVSMGGNGALRYAHHRSDVFSTVASISGPVMNTERMLSFVNDRIYAIIIPTHRIFGPPEPRERIEADDLFLRWTSQEDTHMRSTVLAWGTRDRDGLPESNREFDRHLTEHAIAHEAWEYDGGHDWVSWTPVINRALAHQLRGPAEPPPEEPAEEPDEPSSIEEPESP